MGGPRIVVAGDVFSREAVPAELLAIFAAAASAKDEYITARLADAAVAALKRCIALGTVREHGPWFAGASSMLQAGLGVAIDEFGTAFDWALMLAALTTALLTNGCVLLAGLIADRTGAHRGVPQYGDPRRLGALTRQHPFKPLGATNEERAWLGYAV